MCWREGWAEDRGKKGRCPLELQCRDLDQWPWVHLFIKIMGFQPEAKDVALETQA
jgi:hypothetical protein